MKRSLIAISLFLIIVTSNSPVWARGMFGFLADAPCLNWNDSYTKLLIKSNTTDGSTTFTDSAAGSTTYTITAYNGVHHSTDQHKWGTSSIEYHLATQDRLSVGNDPAWNFGTGDFTLETWIMFKDPVGPVNIINYNSSHTWEFTSGTSTISILDTTAGINITGTWSPGYNTWYYISAERSGNNLILYASGVSVASADVTGKSINWDENITPTPLSIGRYNPAIGGGNFSGYLDVIAISKGIARNGGAATYEVPNGPYCN